MSLSLSSGLHLCLLSRVGVMGAWVSPISKCVQPPLMPSPLCLLPPLLNPHFTDEEAEVRL